MSAFQESGAERSAGWRQGDFEECSVLRTFELAQLGFPPVRDASRLIGAAIGVDRFEEKGAGDDFGVKRTVAVRLTPPRRVRPAGETDLA